MIREFKPSDLEEILEIEKKSFRDPWKKWEFDYHRALSNFLVYEADDKVAGYVIFNLKGHIENIAIDPTYRRTGIGTKLVQEVTKRSKHAWVEVRVSNKIAQEFYKKLRFEKRHVIPRYYGDEDALVMELYK